MAINRSPVPDRAGRLAQADVAWQTAIRPGDSTDDLISKSKKPVRGRTIIAVTMVTVLGFIILWTNIVLPWWQGIEDQWQYGDSRITQLNADVGHGGISHFLAEYYHQQIIIIEMSRSDPKKYHTYTSEGLYSTVGTPIILLSVEDINHDGKLDLVIQVKGTMAQTVLYNTGDSFSANEVQP